MKAKVVNLSISDGDFRNRNKVIMKEDEERQRLVEETLSADEVVETWELGKLLGLKAMGDEQDIIIELRKLQGETRK